MSSKTQSERSSASSSPAPRSSPRSLIVSKVSLNKGEAWLFNDLSYYYDGVKKVSRNHDQDGNKLGSIRVDFDSEEVVSEILENGAIYIADRDYYIRPYWPLVCYRCHNEGHRSAECPQYSLPEWRLAQLIDEQKANFEGLISDFENRWTTRLAKLATPKSADLTKLSPVVNGLTNVCQQLNQQNLQMQQQLRTVTNRIQNMQTKVNQQ